MNETSTWCFFTKFVCRYDQLDEAKARHQRCVDVVREKNRVHFSSEQAYQAGHSEPTFELLLSEIIPPSEKLSPEDEAEYSVFFFVTVADVPCDPNEVDDAVRLLSAKLEIDFESGIPAKFPSRTRGIRVSETGHEIEQCIYQ